MLLRTQTWSVTILVSLMVFVATPAVAQAPAEPTSIEALYEAGKEALGNKKPAVALEHFKAALSKSEGRSVIT